MTKTIHDEITTKMRKDIADRDAELAALRDVFRAAERMVEYADRRNLVGMEIAALADACELARNKVKIEVTAPARQTGFRKGDLE